MYRALPQATPNTILRPDAPPAYKSLQHVITEDDGPRMLGHDLRKRAPHLGGKAEDIQKMSMICESSIQNTLPLLSTGQPYSISTLSFPERMFTQTSSLNKFLPNSCPSKILLLFLETSTPVFFIFYVNVVVQFSMKKTP